MNVIVVGVDHSPGAKAALVFAEEEARLRGATLRAVHAWQYGYIGYTGLEGGMPVLGGDIRDMHAAAEAALDASVREALPDSDVEIEQRTVQGAAAGVLVDESRDADCWSSARADTAGSRSFCWARSASNAHTTPSARS